MKKFVTPEEKQARKEKVLAADYSDSAALAGYVSMDRHSELNEKFIQHQIESVELLLGQAKTIQALQARIDALMFEYCPDEMTKEQIVNYESAVKATDVDIET